MERAWIFRFLLGREHTVRVGDRCYATPPAGTLAQTTAAFSGIGVIDRFNQGALLQLRYGEVGRAEKLCLRAISICRKRSADDFAPWAGVMLSPYVSLGRLKAVRGDVAGSLEIYRTVFLAQHELRDTTILDFPFPSRAIASALKARFGETREGELYRDANHMFLVDSARSLLNSGCFEKVLEFIAGLAQFGSSTFEEALILELRALALTELGQLDEALTCVAQWAHRIRSPLFPLLLKTEIHMLSGDRAGVLDSFDRLCAAVERSSEALLVRVGYLFYRLALCMLIGTESGRAYYCADLAHKLAEHGGNHSVALKSSMILAFLCDSDPGRFGERARENWRSRLQAATRSTPVRMDRALGHVALAHLSPNASELAVQHLQSARALARSIESWEACLLLSRIDSSEPAGSPRIPGDWECTLAEARDEAIEESYTRLMNWDPSV